MCRNAYDEEMFVQMEMHILSTLEWSISHPTLEDCLQLAINSSRISVPAVQSTSPYHQDGAHDSKSVLSAVTAVGRFLCELSLYDKFFLSVPTSLIAITCNLLSCSMLQIPNASDALKELLEETIMKSKREQLQQQRREQKQANNAIPRHPIINPNTNTLYRNNNESNYSHQQMGVRHSSIDDDIDLDYDEEDDDDYIDDFYEMDQDEENSSASPDDTNDTTFDEELENKPPKIHGAFLSGLDENSLLTIKRIALVLIIQLSKVTEVLSKKY
jgi:hypothetical protein